MNLHFREYGQGKPLLILHGLFGSADNWMTQAKALGEQFRVFTIDQRNHGLSPHDPIHNYSAMAADLNEFIQQQNLERPIIIGHSMGGKTAMNLAIEYPDQLSRLIVVDIMPKAYPVHHDIILQGLKSLHLDAITTRNQADEQLANFVDEPDVRQFLLKNLARKSEGGFIWKMNLNVLDRNIEEMGAALLSDKKFEWPTLFIVGSRSNYYKQGDEQIISKYFPNSSIVKLDTGHWVQAEKPKEFVAEVLKFIWQ